MNSIVVVKPAGDKGLGLFATQDIRQGQRILEESPLLALSDVMASAHIWRDFQAMSKTDLAKFRDLSFHADAVSAAQVRIVHARLAQGGAEGGGLREMLADEMMMRAIFSCNCVSMGTAMQWGVGVFELYSRINHSCIPNVHHSYNPELNKEVVHATRDIVAGEEVLTSYTKLIRPHDLRRSELLRYGFACSCAACEGPAYREHERRRRRLCDIDQKFAVRDASSSLGGARARPSAASITKDLALAKENTTLLEEEGLSGMDLALRYGRRSTAEHSITDPSHQPPRVRQSLLEAREEPRRSRLRQHGATGERVLSRPRDGLHAGRRRVRPFDNPGRRERD